MTLISLIRAVLLRIITVINADPPQPPGPALARAGGLRDTGTFNMETL